MRRSILNRALSISLGLIALFSVAVGSRADVAGLPKSPAPQSSIFATSEARHILPANACFEVTRNGHILADFLDVAYAANDADLRKDFEGKVVEVVAQCVPDGKAHPAGAGFRLARWGTTVGGDVIPVFGPAVEIDEPLRIPTMTWVRVTGTVTYPKLNGRRQAVIKATSVVETAAE